MDKLIMKDMLNIITASPKGISAGEIEKMVSLSRPTINRRLKEALDAGLIIAEGQGAARVYVDADPLRPVRQYFNTPLGDRPFAKYREELLEYRPSLETFKLNPVGGFKIDKRDLVQFLVDFACASSVLEGGTYSLLDTQALIEYGEKAEGKPLPDAFLVLNHKNAFEYLYDHLSLDSIFEVHKRLTDDHGLPELKGSPHFLDSEQLGVVREYEEVRINTTTYSPPFRPGTGYIKNMLNYILNTSTSIEDPIESAFYLLTRLPYLQPFADGNKRTSRAMCNVPLMLAGLPPISFMDFGKQDYIISMLSFYELGDTKFAAATFSSAYQKSWRRLQNA
jgi:Fic family protein